MYMRFLGYGIGHVSQNKGLRYPSESDNQVDLEEDIPDLQNMARIAQENSKSPTNPAVAHDLTEQPVLTDSNNDSTINDTRDCDDSIHREELDAVSEARADGGYDLGGDL